MLKVGLTGNIGSGKSAVSSIFSTLGIPVYHADAESKKFLADEAVISALKEQFGPTILRSRGQIDTRALGKIVFSDPAALAFLNSLLHPRVRLDAREWASGQKGVPYLIHEAAIIFESGFRDEYDRVIYVSCPRETAVQRVMARDGISGEDVMARLQNQWSDEQKIPLSDFVIVNDGAQLLIPQVMEIHRKLSHIVI
jgi:dephospho-CoA kinase